MRFEKAKRYSKVHEDFKEVLRSHKLTSQQALSLAMESIGYGKVSQPRVSRLLLDVGAFKCRDHNNVAYYKLPEELAVPNQKNAINSVVLDIRHNQQQIVIRTIKGGGCMIGRMVEEFAEYCGVLGCIASDNTVLVIPQSIDEISTTINKVSQQLDILTSN